MKDDARGGKSSANSLGAHFAADCSLRSKPDWENATNQFWIVLFSLIKKRLTDLLLGGVGSGRVGPTHCNSEANTKTWALRSDFQLPSPDNLGNFPFAYFHLSPKLLMAPFRRQVSLGGDDAKIEGFSRLIQ
jgi:hypothetical protein